MSKLKGLLKTQELARVGVLYAPASFLVASEQELLDTCNGCGAAGSWFRPPSKMWGTDIEPACNIHDWMYSKGYTIEDKHQADETMQNNIDRLIDRDSHKWYKPTILQHCRSRLYFLGVSWFGGSAYWKGKNGVV